MCSMLDALTRGYDVDGRRVLCVRRYAVDDGGGGGYVCRDGEEEKEDIWCFVVLIVFF